MKIKAILSAILFAFSVQVMAQIQSVNLLANQIVGTWKMVSQSVKDIDGSSFKSDVSKFSQYKIITPTHWMYMNYDKDSLKGGGDGGTYELNGNKYTEALTDNLKTDFTVRVEGNKLMQDGDIILPDGKRMTFNEVYERVAEPTTTSSDVGVWNMTSYQISRNGKKVAEPGITELLINTPTHFMWVDKKKNGEVINAMYGEYTREANNKLTVTPILASFPIDKKEKADVTSAIKGDQMTSSVKITKGDGNTEQWDMVHQKVGKAKLAKAVSN
jgi:hypothetical protein